jgi:hypothetical protein
MPAASWKPRGCHERIDFIWIIAIHHRRRIGRDHLHACCQAGSPPVTWRICPACIPTMDMMSFPFQTTQSINISRGENGFRGNDF